jgi:zinc D-Ala-D-Ala dipeptidase
VPRRVPTAAAFVAALSAVALAIVGSPAGARPAPEPGAQAAHAPGAGDTDPGPPVDGALARAGLVDVRTYAPRIRLDVRYATTNNFTGRRLPGYCRPWAVLRRSAARRLGRVQRALERSGLGLLVYDAYRPARATRAMVRWAQRTGNEWVLRHGWVARRSNHALGTTVDLTLVRLSTGNTVRMGTAYDAFTRRSYTLNARGTALRNRLRLRRAMARQGFANYQREWWHYDGPRGPRRFDLTLGC